MALSGSMRTSASYSNTLSGVDLSTPTESISQTITNSATTGVLYHDQYNLSTSEAYSIDVGDSSLSDVFGNTLAITTVTGILIIADSTNTVDITIDTGSTSMFNQMPPLSAGESFCFNGDIDTSTNSKLYITNGAAGGIVTIIIVGTE